MLKPAGLFIALFLRSVERFFPFGAARSLAVLSACAIIYAALAFLGPALAQSINLDLGDGGGGLTGRVIQLIALTTVLTLAPSILIVITSFVRIVVVFSILRTALGTQSTPPNAVLVSLALFLTFFIMQPVLERAYTEGVQPLIEERIDEQAAFDRAVAPFHQFMRGQVREKDLALFTGFARLAPPASPEAIPLRVLVPAYMISELKRAFEIGFLLFIPFIVVDMVVASILMSMGMMMLPPVVISLPFKLIFFVLVDGWNLVCAALVESFMGPPPGG
ncbi:flagellar type III secretion system pore protein FliP [Ferrovibrio sp.]|uniref:flagellar type III secretion system pore protein FliP n=1 Tax=Ferrovibrio sp. TaxID=1917215 RepID=UPI0035B0D7A3